MKPNDSGDERESSKQLTFSFECTETEQVPTVSSMSSCYGVLHQQCSVVEKGSSASSGVVLTFSFERREEERRAALISRIMHRTRFF